jgi:hypothetical protein
VKASKAHRPTDQTVTEENHTVLSIRHLAHRLKSFAPLTISGNHSGSVNSSAIRATEDAAPRSFVASARARKRAALGCVAIAMGLFLTATPALAAPPAPGWQLWATTDPSDLVDGVNAVQEVRPESPSFTLELEGQQTAAISSSASAGEVQAALEALSFVGNGNVSVSTQAGDYIVTFTGSLGNSRIARLNASGASVSVITRGNSSGTIRVAVMNIGAAASEIGKPITIVDSLPPGVTARQAGALDPDGDAVNGYPFGPRFEPGLWDCTGNGLGPSPGVEGATVVTCTNDPTGLPQIAGGAGSPTVGPGGYHPEPTLGIAVDATGEASGLTNSVSISGGGALGSAATSDPIAIGSPNQSGGIASGEAYFSNADGTTDTQAGSHPYAASFAFTPATAINSNNELFYPGDGNDTGAGLEIRGLETSIPAGLVGDLAKMPTCSSHELFLENCDPNSMVGSVVIETPILSLQHPVFNMLPAQGSAAQLGFNFNGVSVPIRFGVKTGGDYSIFARLQSPEKDILQTVLTLWGVPQEESHDIWHDYEGGCSEAELEEPESNRGELSYCSRAFYVGAPEEAFLTLPTSCAGPQPFSFNELSAWADPDFTSQAGGLTHDAEGNPAGFIGCNKLPFGPSISAKPTTNVADAPSGLDFDLHFPQTGLEDPEAEVSEADLKRAVVTLPKGVAVNPAAAGGLGACSEAQIGYLGKEAGLNTDRYTPGAAACPDAAKIGTVEVDTPLLRDRNEAGQAESEHPLLGAVYVAKPVENPFGSLLAIYIAIDDPATGIVVKLAGEVHADPQTGQLTATVENPQVPFEDVHLKFFEGAGAPLRTPQTCGTFTTATEMTPWSSPEGADAFPTDSFELTQGAGGAPCVSHESELPDKPNFSAGTLQPKAGAFSPFTLHLARQDGSQEIKGIDTTLPEGLIGKLAGVKECSDAQIAQAASRNKLGDGALELSSPSCPQSSEVGTVNVGAGAGPRPFYVSGHAYLAGPYKGAPLSLEIITPAVAGPFDLGTVAVRTALFVDPETTQIHAVSDEIPHILQGIPLDVRSIDLQLNRNQFALNPTSCEKKTILGSATSLLGQATALSSPFQVGECTDLAFKPKLAIHLTGPTKRGRNPSLKATLTYPKGAYANIAKAAVTLPHSEFLAQEHIKTICTRVQFAEGNTPGEKCPAGSIYGQAEAVTPLLDKPLKGPVYLRSSSHNLPDLVAALNGQINVDLDGRIDSVKGGIRNTFEMVPDAPVSKFTLEMQGGKKGLLVNSTNICKSTNKATVLFDGQNGKSLDVEPVVTNDCKGKKHKRAHKSSKGKH